jgi:hypothetical protein
MAGLHLLEAQEYSRCGQRDREQAKAWLKPVPLNPRFFAHGDELWGRHSYLQPAFEPAPPWTCNPGQPARKPAAAKIGCPTLRRRRACDHCAILGRDGCHIRRNPCRCSSCASANCALRAQDPTGLERDAERAARRGGLSEAGTFSEDRIVQGAGRIQQGASETTATRRSSGGG